MLVSYRTLAPRAAKLILGRSQTSKMASLDDGLLPDEASGPQRVFEGDLVVPLMSPWLDLSDLLRLAQTNKACMRDIEIGVREIGLTEFEDPPTGRITDAVIASISRRFPSLRVLYLIRRSPHLTFIHCLGCKHLEKSSIFWHCYREFENDHLQCHHPAMQSMAWHVPESELRELPPAAIAALGYEFEEA